MPGSSAPERRRAPERRTVVILSALLVIAGAACLPREPGGDAAGNIATPGTGWYRGDLHYHTTYSEDALRQGGDDLATALAIADAYRDPIYLAVYPEHAGDALDFVAITDHRTDAALSDPAFGHPRLIVVPGEEYGGGGHAGVFGLRHHIPHQPQHGESQNERHRDAVREAHAQGAVFSPNHPCQDNRWPWTLEEVNGIEVWNSVWSIFWGESKVEDLDRDLVANGYENPYLRSAVAASGGGPNAQALRLWYNLLSRGRHVALLGGSDRHMVVPAGLPTTYVRRPDLPEFAGRVGKELGWEGIVAGIRAGGTFVSRSPHAAQVVMEAEDAAGVRYPLGARLPGPGTYRLHIRVGRAAGGLLRLVSGPLLPGEGPVAAQPRVVLERALQRNLEVIDWEWVVPDGGGWLHALVLEQRIAEALPPELDPLVEATSQLSEGNSLAASLAAIVPLVDLDPLLDASKCDPAAWVPFRGQCMPADPVTGGTFYIPDALNRLLNTWFEGGEPTPWCLGALTSAFLAPAAG